MTLSSRGHRRACDQFSIVIKRDSLVCDRDDDLERALRSVIDLSALHRFRFCVPVPVLVLVPEWSVMAPPGPVLGPKRELGVRDLERKYENSKCCHHYRADGSHIDASRNRCGHAELTAALQANCRLLSRSGP